MKKNHFLKTLVLTLSILPLSSQEVQNPKPEKVDQLATIIQQREEVLLQIVKLIKKELKSASGSFDELIEAELRLQTFRRDSARKQIDREKWQNEIVGLESKKERILLLSLKNGEARPIDVFRAKERVLAAEQKLLEIMAEK